MPHQFVGGDADETRREPALRHKRGLGTVSLFHNSGNGKEVVEAALAPKDTVYLDWGKAMAVELDGLKCAVVDIEDIKLVV